MAVDRKEIAVLGGSGAFLPNFADALAAQSDILPHLEIKLIGRSAERTEIVAEFANRRARAAGFDHHYDATTSIADGCLGADIVVNLIRVGGFPGRRFDETFPLEYGLPGDETIGPGGLASALRSVPVITEAAAIARRVASGAPFINMSNPMGILCAALDRIDGLDVFGLCELPQVTLERAAELLGRPIESLRFDYFGLNHQGFFTRIDDLDGRSLLPEFFDAAERRGDSREKSISVAIMRDWGALPLSYLRLFFSPEKEVAAAVAKSVVRADELADISRRLMREFADKNSTSRPALLDRRETPWFEKCLVPAIAARLGRQSADVFLTERNGKDIPDLDPSTVVEKSVVLLPNGSRIVRRPKDVPQRIVDFVRRIAAFEKSALEAALSPGRATIEAALAAIPLPIERSRIAAMAERILLHLEESAEAV